MNNIAENGIITLYAGDTFIAPIFLNAGDNTCPVRYTLEEGDKLYVGIMEPNQPFECALVRKLLTKDDLNAWGDPELKLSPEDTEHIMPGTYYYEAKLVTTDKEGKEVVQTVISKRKLYVLE